ncbi:hypothetical protein ACJX0J_027788, partial [Zea mays]
FLNLWQSLLKNKLPHFIKENNDTKSSTISPDLEVYMKNPMTNHNMYYGGYGTIDLKSPIGFHIVLVYSLRIYLQEFLYINQLVTKNTRYIGLFYGRNKNPTLLLKNRQIILRVILQGILPQKIGMRQLKDLQESRGVLYVIKKL